MKNTGKCPKCGGTDIIKVEDDVWGNMVKRHAWLFFVFCDRYVCGNCGFIEEWMRSPSDIEKLR